MDDMQMLRLPCLRFLYGMQFCKLLSYITANDSCLFLVTVSMHAMCLQVLLACAVVYLMPTLVVAKLQQRQRLQRLTRSRLRRHITHTTSPRSSEVQPSTAEQAVQAVQAAQAVDTAPVLCHAAASGTQDQPDLPEHQALLTSAQDPSPPIRIMTKSKTTANVTVECEIVSGKSRDCCDTLALARPVEALPRHISMHQQRQVTPAARVRSSSLLYRSVAQKRVVSVKVSLVG